MGRPTPGAPRHGEPAFEHHAELPRTELGDATATVLVGELDGLASPSRHDTDLVGVDLQLRGRTNVPLRTEHEHALVVLEGAILPAGHERSGTVDSTEGPVGPGHLLYLAPGHDELALESAGPTRLLLLGGVPFESQILMWWNFVARERDEVDRAREDWQLGDDRFGETGSPLDRIPAPPVPWQR